MANIPCPWTQKSPSDLGEMNLALQDRSGALRSGCDDSCGDNKIIQHSPNEGIKCQLGPGPATAVHTPPEL